MKKALVAILGILVVGSCLSAMISFEGKILTASTTATKYQVGGSATEYARRVSVNVTGSETVFFMPNVKTNSFVATNAIPVRAGFPHTFYGQISYITYATTNGTASFDLSAQGQ